MRPRSKVITCVVKFPGNHPLPPPYSNPGEMWGGSMPIRSDHSGLSSTPKLNFSVISIKHRFRGTCGMWNTPTWRNKPPRGCWRWQLGNIRGLTAGLGLRGNGLCAVVAEELQAEFIYELVECAKAVHLRTCGMCESWHGSLVCRTMYIM